MKQTYQCSFKAIALRIATKLDIGDVRSSVYGNTVNAYTNTAGEQIVLADAIDFEREIYGEASVVKA